MQDPKITNSSTSASEVLLDESFDAAFYGVETEDQFLSNEMKSSTDTWRQEEEMWEDNLLHRTGLKGKKASKKLDLDESSSGRLEVKTARPSFLNHESQKMINLTGMKQTISVVKDESSDLSLHAKEGSKAVLKFRQEKSRTSFRQRFWELGGSKIGKVIKAEDRSEEVEQKDSSVSSNKFIQKDSKTLSVQLTPLERQKMKITRESLPIFSVRDELVNLVRENQVVVIIGETGSGKTTQLTQYLYEEGFCSPPSNSSSTLQI
eukprot:maker-scaffold_1-snap-gene-26.55-mRNA-1 protein AED:0.40 eAED:0.40 QI:0/0/0/1/1/1/2/0/262